MTETRQRGVRLSRLKLASALKDAGLDTQAALAERICELEGHSRSPKNLLSRAFREIPVQVESAERIARALGVPVHTLFLASGDTPLADGLTPATDTQADPAPGDEALAAARPVPRALWAAALLACVVLLGLLLRPTRDARDDADLQVLAALGSGNPMLAVTAIGGDSAERLADELRAALGDTYRVASRSASLFLGGDGRKGPSAARQRIGADIVLEINGFDVGRRTGFSALLATDTVRHRFFTGMLMKRAPERARRALVAQLVTALDQALGRRPGSSAPVFQPTPESLAYYLEGRDHLDIAPRELAIRRAQSSFQAALRADAADPLAQAGLCEALLEEYWMNDEQRTIRDAEGICAKAVALAPEAAAVRIAQARLLQVTGRNDEALAVFADIVAEQPDQPEALLGLAIAHHTAYRHGGPDSHLAAAIEHAQRATQIDSDNWKPPFRLGAMLFDNGQLDAGIAATRAAVERWPSEFALANLGTMHSCAGNFAAAERAYLKADEVSGTSHIDNEMLGQLYYYLERYDESERYRQQAIDSVASGRPDIHYLWGGLADSLRQQGKTARAVEAYTDALRVVERDIMAGNQTVEDEAARAYYYSVLATLDRQTVPSGVRADVRRSLDELAAKQVYPAGLRFIALAYLLNDRQDAAQEWLKKAAARCPGYLRYPDFKGLAASARQD